MFVKMLILEITAMLQPFIKNPHSLAVERSVIQTLRDTCDQVLTATAIPTPVK